MLIHLTRGFTLLTQRTKSWTSAERDANDAEERMMLFVNFTIEDQGRGRIMIARFTDEKRLLKFKKKWNTAKEAAYPAMVKGKRDTKEIRYSCLRQMIQQAERKEGR